MDISRSAGLLKKFRRTPWSLQTTFATPLDDLDNFVGTILSANAPFANGSVTISQIVFEPKNLIGFLSNHSPVTNFENEWGGSWNFTVRDPAQIHVLLRAALSDWADFLFVPTPKPFVIYADYDEYATFYAHTKKHLRRVTDSLLARGFKQVEDYHRSFA